MTYTLGADATRPAPVSVAKSAKILPRTFQGTVEAACAAFFVKAGYAGPLDASDRSIIADAIVEILSLDHEQRIALRAGSSCLLLVFEGWALRSYTLRDGSRQITDVMLPGDVCDWMPTRSADVSQDIRACGSARIAILRKDAVLRRASPAIWHWRQWAHDVETQMLRARLVSVGRRDAVRRVAYLIAELHHRLRRAGLADANAFESPLTQEQLADVLGLTPVHFNRMLQALRRENLVLFSRPRFTLPNLARLHVAAGFDEGSNDAHRWC